MKIEGKISSDSSLNGLGSSLSNLNPQDAKNLMAILSNQLHEKDLDNLKLRLTKEYELKIKDLEKIHYERM